MCPETDKGSAFVPVSTEESLSLAQCCMSSQSKDLAVIDVLLEAGRTSGYCRSKAVAFRYATLLHYPLSLFNGRNAAQGEYSLFALELVEAVV